MSSASVTVPVVGATPGTAVQVLPGQRFVPLPPEAVMVVGVCELVPAGGGTFRPVARICPQWFTLSKANLRRLGVAISTRSMQRLIVSGFVRGQQVTPGGTQFDYHSYLAHEAAVADPEFWSQRSPGHSRTNRERYLEAVAMGV